MNDILALSGLAQARAMRDGAISSAELVELHLNQIAETNPRINAAVEALAETARKAAWGSDRRRAAGAARSLFEGVPFSVKDSIQVEGTVCSAGTIGLRNAPASRADATLVARIRDAGGIPVARTNLPDLLFAFETDNLICGCTRNPYDLSRTSGGSSGGEAALIASCGSPFGLGSDAAGSVRLPAHFCGIAAIKPTSGRLPRTGHVPPAGGWLEAVWQIGPMARHVEDLVALFPLLLGGDGLDPTVIEMPWREPLPERSATLRLGWFTDNGIASPTQETAATVQAAAQSLKNRVNSVREHLPKGIQQSYDLLMMLIGPDGGDGLREYLRIIGSTCQHPLLEGWLSKLERYRTSLAGFANYWSELDRFRACMWTDLADFDVLISPACANPALPHGASIEENNFRGFSYTMTWNVMGWPAAVVRCGTSAEGLPIGIQIIAHPWREDLALQVAAILEKEFGGWIAPPLVNVPGQ